MSLPTRSRTCWSRRARWSRSLAERAAATNAARDVSPETIADFHRIGILRIIQPRRFGGLQLRFSLFSRIVEILTEGCASSGWVYAVLGEHQWLLASYPLQAQIDVWGDDPQARRIVLAGAARRGRTHRRRLAAERAVPVLQRQQPRALGDHRRVSRRAGRSGRHRLSAGAVHRHRDHRRLACARTGRHRQPFAAAARRVRARASLRPARAICWPARRRARRCMPTIRWCARRAV